MLSSINLLAHNGDNDNSLISKYDSIKSIVETHNNNNNNNVFI